jgi:hypothetical protein
VLIACGFTALSRAIAPPYRHIAAAVALALFVAVRLSFAEAHGSLGSMSAGERRYVDVGEYVASNLPPDAAIFSMQHSGSLRFYGGRLTLRYDWVQPEWAKDVPPVVERAGYHPYLIIDDWEVPEVRKHWAVAADAPLPWPVLARRREVGPVTIFDLATNAPPSPRPFELRPGSLHRCAAPLAQ